MTELKSLIKDLLIELSKIDAQQDSELANMFAEICAEIANSTKDRNIRKALDEAFKI